MDLRTILLLMIILVIMEKKYKSKEINNKCSDIKKIKKVRFNNTPQIKYFEKENFYGNSYKGDYNIDDEYYNDKLGLKGYNYIKLDPNILAGCSNNTNNTNNTNNFLNTIHKLELYNSNFYDK